MAKRVKLVRGGTHMAEAYVAPSKEQSISEATSDEWMLNVSGPRHECDQCGQRFGSNAALQRHAVLKSCRLGGKPTRERLAKMKGKGTPRALPGDVALCPTCRKRMRADRLAEHLARKHPHAQSPNTGEER